MKKIKIVSILCIMILTLCGCSMKSEYDMQIKKDKSMDFSVIIGFDNEMLDGMLSMENIDSEQTTYTDEQRWQMIDNSISEDPTEFGFKSSKYEEGEYKGYKYIKTISNIDKVSGTSSDFTLEGFQNISDSVVFVKNGENYKADFVMNNEEMSNQTQGYNVGIEMKFIVTLPNKPISHNATEVSKDGKTLTWNLLDSSSQNIQFEFSFENNTILYIAIAGGAILLISIISIIFISKNKKSKKSGSVNSNEPVETQDENSPSFLEPQVAPMQPVMSEPQITPVQPVMSEPQIAPIQPVMSESQVTPVQPVMSEPQITPVQPVMSEPQIAPIQPVMSEPQVTPVQPVMSEPQITPIQPVMSEPQIAPIQPVMSESQVAPIQQNTSMPSVADIMGLPKQDNNQ